MLLHRAPRQSHHSPATPFQASILLPCHPRSTSVSVWCSCMSTFVCVRTCAPFLVFTPDQLFRWQKRREKALRVRNAARECEPLTKKYFHHRVVVYDCLATKLNRSFSTHPSVYARTKRKTSNERESFKRTIKPRVYINTYTNSIKPLNGEPSFTASNHSTPTNSSIFYRRSKLL